ncbi:TonB-dependent receptor [Oleiharenicola lentus]|uniref:TonB-dependent receptor n=2 Tax=Oleiharenicola lentus TaxID=2508720 RepID=A0A4Q1C4P6_9BACT|nr:TonB-dependent receptor [Oleiharenicola lentus]
MTAPQGSHRAASILPQGKRVFDGCPVSKAHYRETNMTPRKRTPAVARLSVWSAIILGVLLTGGMTAQTTPPSAVGGLQELSFEELAGITVTTVSKREERYFNAAAAVHVITGEDIRRSGALMLPDALRLAPGVEVGAINSRSYAVAMRGFNGTASNKLLPLIDGRSLYSQRFASTIWDIRDLPLEEVEQIEVIGGPGGTAWGANAVNGVINIITKSARDTQGDRLAAVAGTFESGQVYARRGFSVGSDAWARVYVKAFSRDDSEPLNIADNNDAWSQVRAGFRYDRGEGGQAVTMMTGDVFYSAADQLVAGLADQAHSSGGHFLARRRQQIGELNLQLQGYVDVIRRDSGGNLSEADVLELESLVSGSFGPGYEWSAGLNYRRSRLTDSVNPTTGVVSQFTPEKRWFTQGGLFFEAARRPPAGKFDFSVGTKAEYNEFTQWEFLPSVRATWKPRSDITFWSAWSRAARIPSRFENDQVLVVSVPGFQSRTLPSPALEAEVLSAMELGWRWQAQRGFYLDATVFHHRYSRLVTTRSTAVGPTSIEQDLENGGFGTSRGAEIQAVWRIFPWWQWQAAYTYLDLDLEVSATSSDSSLGDIANLSPRQQFSVRSSWNLDASWEIDAWFRAVGKLNQTGRVIPAYETLDLRIGRQFGRGWEVSVVGQNLLEPSHPEFRFFTVRAAVARGFYLRVERRR